MDTLTGGAGKDTFRGTIDQLSGDTITDFSIDDVIVISNVDLSALNGQAASGSLLLETGKSLNLTDITSASGTFVASFESGSTLVTLAPPVAGGGGGSSQPSRSTQDGATLTETTGRAPGGGVQQVLQVAPTTSNRVEDTGTTNSDLADITLATLNNQPVLRMGLPMGVGLTASGPSTVLKGDARMRDLIARIEERTDSGSSAQQQMVGEGNGFFATLGEDTDLMVRTLVPTVSVDTAPEAPMVISGDSSSSISVALVIDVRQLPSGTVVQLDNVAFAAVTGAVTLTGGAGNNMVVGDDASQSIVLGEGDDVLHGGGGNDTVGSQGGDDLIYGEDGNDRLFGGAGQDQLHGGRNTDTVSYEGNRDDYLISQLHGVVTVQAKADPNDMDTLVNVEFLSFADGNEGIGYGEELSWLAGLYGQVLGRQADVAGMQYWAQRHAEGMERADIALSFLNAAETNAPLPEGEAVLDSLYHSLLGREADAEGRAYWADELAAGRSLGEVVAGFMHSVEMREHDLGANQWDFIA